MKFLEQFFGFIEPSILEPSQKNQSMIQFKTRLNSIYSALNQNFKNIYNISFD